MDSDIDGCCTVKPPFYELMASNLREVGYSIHSNALPRALGDCLWIEAHAKPGDEFSQAGIGRNAKKAKNKHIRSDEISWIDSGTATGESWISWAAAIQSFLNQNLFLGLYSFESHYALYKPGCYYQRHQDAFQGDSNRILSLVIYLNRNWQPYDAGELVLFTGEESKSRIISPRFGTLVAFLSEEIEHEVLTTTKDRHSIAGWFRTKRPGNIPH